MNIELKRINVSYIEQNPRSFYGMYLYNDTDSNHFLKLDIVKANSLLKVLTQNISEIKDLELPRKLTSENIKILNKIKTHLNEAEPNMFDWDDIMDIS